MRPRIGFLVPPPYWKARVAGVYTKAISLLHADGALVSLLRGAKDMEARAIALEGGWEGFARRARHTFERADEDGPAFVEYRMPAGEGGALGPILALCVGEGDGPSGPSREGRDFTLELVGAEPWDPRYELREARLDARFSATGLSASLAAAAALIESALKRRPSARRDDDGIGGAGPFAEAFARLKGRLDFPACLVGFGPGTTPAGDDWLAGYLAAVELGSLAAGPDGAAGAPERTSPALARLRADLSAGLARTGAAGRALLLGSLAGAPPAYLSRVRQACLRCGADGGSALTQAIAEALTHGASSGRDSLAGFQAGLEDVQDFSPRE